MTATLIRMGIAGVVAFLVGVIVAAYAGSAFTVWWAEVVTYAVVYLGLIAPMPGRRKGGRS